MAISLKLANGFSQNKLCCNQQIKYFILNVHKTIQHVKMMYITEKYVIFGNNAKEMLPMTILVTECT